MRIECKVEGLDKAQIKMAKARAGFVSAVSRVMYQWAEGVMAQSKRIVPYETGALESSGHVPLPRVLRGQEVEVILGYGNSAVGYAVFVHENLRASHAPGRTAKYLEIPFTAGLPRLRQDLNKTIADLLR